MQKPPIKLPPDPFGAIFRIHADAVRRSPELSRLGAVVVVQDGADADGQVPTKLPWVRLACQPRESTWLASEGLPGSRVLTCPFRITVETKVEGTRLEDSSRLGFAVLNAMFPDDPTAIEAALDAAGLQERTPSQLWWGIGVGGANGERLPSPPSAIYAMGHIDLSVQLTM